MVWQDKNDVHPVVISVASAIGLAFNLSPHFSPVMIIADSHILLSVYGCKEGYSKIPCLGPRITSKETQDNTSWPSHFARGIISLPFQEHRLSRHKSSNFRTDCVCRIELRHVLRCLRGYLWQTNCFEGRIQTSSSPVFVCEPRSFCDRRLFHLLSNCGSHQQTKFLA
jgi:hypothetical protein